MSNAESNVETGTGGAPRSHTDHSLRTDDRLPLLFENSLDAMMIADDQGRYLDVNPAACDLFGYAREHLLGMTVADLMMPGSPDSLEQYHRYVNSGRDTGEFTVVRADGQVRIVSYTACRLSPGQHISILRDITERKVFEQQLSVANAQLEAANSRLATLATHDSLTGLNNRRAFQDFLAAEFQRLARHHGNEPISLLLIDIDHFKSYNDSYGHIAGDQVLVQVAQVIQQSARNVDFVARFGGEEFVAVLPCTDARGSRIAAERFRASIEATSFPHRSMTASVGAATSDADERNPAVILAHADRALYASKQRGRNRTTHFPDTF